MWYEQNKKVWLKKFSIFNLSPTISDFQVSFQFRNSKNYIAAWLHKSTQYSQIKIMAVVQDLTKRSYFTESK